MGGEAKYGVWESNVKIEKYLPKATGSHFLVLFGLKSIRANLFKNGNMWYPEVFSHTVPHSYGPGPI